MKVKRNILLNPGPATTTETVKLAQIVPDICPREEEFGLILNEISQDLTSFVADKSKYSTILFGGSGTAAVESILSSVLPKNNKIIIVNNGSYGERMCKIARRYNLNYIEFKSSNISALDILKLEETIKLHKTLSHIAIVHNETTTGLLNDIEKISMLAKKYKLEFIVDAMSSYGAIPINMDAFNITYLAASSNKNLQGLPGVSFVVAKINSLKKLKDVEQLSYYLSLKEQYEYLEANKQTRFTPPVQTLYALKQAIKETKSETIKNRYERYKKSWETLINGIGKLGLSYIVDKANHSKIITAINMPEHINFKELHDYFYSIGITIYPGKINKLNTFRIANIGDIDHKDINKFLYHLKTYLISKSK
ncbi:2-aminoethylphosphonate--pyruvate transaminase [Flavobacteriaceae bacterium]|nr:2-aminoethylphosphonate--pyruvate transaminase [Flavobacteriaceae bacterium]